MNDVDVKQLKEDHDRGVRIETKVDILIQEVKDLKDGTATAIAQHETRIKALEDITGKLLPVGSGTPYALLTEKVNTLMNQVTTLIGDDKYNSFKQKFIWAAFLFIGGVVAWSLNLILTALKIHFLGS